MPTAGRQLYRARGIGYVSSQPWQRAVYGVPPWPGSPQRHGAAGPAANTPPTRAWGLGRHAHLGAIAGGSWRPRYDDHVQEVDPALKLWANEPFLRHNPQSSPTKAIVVDSNSDPRQQAIQTPEPALGQ